MNNKIMKTFYLLIFSLLLVGMVSATVPGTKSNVRMTTPATLSIASTGLKPVVTETGKISWSIDANGENTGSGTLRVLKPAGATVRGAYLMAASTGFSGYHITGSDITLAGSPVTFSTELLNGISSYNYFTDVTSIVKPIIDPASAGTTNLAVTEKNTFNIEGETLVVIFDDPNQLHDNTIILSFGAQQTTGDTFAIGLANPINKSVSGFLLDMSLGISFGFQPSGQYSEVNVNGNRLTTSAGGQDDGISSDGGLITTGGIGDTDANPANPFQTDSAGPRYDDELYSLIPFVNDGDSSISVFTLNPSNDDNIYFAGFFLGSTNAIVGEGVTLDPVSATNQLGVGHTVTATAQYANGTKIEGATMHFEITAGPNVGLNADNTTDSNGKAYWTYTSSTVGTDTIQASFHDVTGKLIVSNAVTKTWEKSQQCISDLTAVSGNVSGPDGPLANVSVKVKCTHNDVDVTLDAFTESDGSYAVVFDKTQCAPGDTVTLSALDKVVTGTVTNNCRCVVNLGILNLTIPEFGVVAAGLALIGAGIIIYRRRN